MSKRIDKFLEIIFDSNPRQKSSILYTMNNYYTNTDYQQLEDALEFYGQEYSIEEIAASYNLIVEDTATETKYFVLNGTYRYSSFEETERLVYSNRDYMSKYMIGLAMSGYLWPNHIKMFHWYQEVLKKVKGNYYLEVGPGHGRYFCESVRNEGFLEYDAIDVSETSVNQTNRYVREFIEEKNQERCHVFLQNAYDYKPSKKYDFIVIAEVLEHVENPGRMLEILNNISNDNSYLYVTVPINAPAIDHIFHFKCIEDVESLVISSGFKILDHLYAPGGDMKIDRAIKRKNSILVGLFARKITK